MSLISRFFKDRRTATILCLSALLPLSAALTACSSEAPKLPEAPRSETTSAKPPTTGAPAGDVDKSMPDKDGGAQPAAEEPAAAAGAEKPAPEKKAGRPRTGAPRAITAAKPPDDQEGAGAGAPAGGSAPPAEVAAVPPPPPPPSPVTAPAPAPSASSGDTDAAVGSPSRGLGIGTPAGAPAAAPPKAFDTVPVFYGTDRVVEPNAKRLQYGTERGHKLQLGRAVVTVPTAHKVPNIERPWVVEIPYFKYKVYEEKEDPAKHFTMQEVAALSKEQMLAYVKERLAKSANFKDHAFVFVHGFNTSFDAAVYRSAQIANDMKFDGVPFVYSWPSGGKVASYTYDRGSAEQSEPHLAEFLDIVVKESGAKSISLIAHSMGNELLMRVLERMRPAVPDGVVISQVILAAPDVDRDKFTNIARQITNFAKGVTLYAASNDKALSYSARFWGGVPRAGDVPASGPLIINGVDTIDVTALSTDSLSLNHSGYAENTTLLEDIALLLQTGERPPDKRVPVLKKIESAAGVFWRYPARTP